MADPKEKTAPPLSKGAQNALLRLDGHNAMNPSQDLDRAVGPVGGVLVARGYATRVGKLDGFMQFSITDAGREEAKRIREANPPKRVHSQGWPFS